MKMTTASPNTDDESKEFTTALEFYEGADEPAGEPPYPAVSIVWYDQRRPVFVCPDHHEVMARFEWDGWEKDPNYSENRGAAYRRLFDESPDCDVCAGTVPEGVL